MDKVKVVVVVLTFVGLMLAMAGALLAFFFDFQAVDMPIMVRYAGLVAAILLFFVGIHVVFAGASSLRSV